MPDLEKGRQNPKDIEGSPGKKKGGGKGKKKSRLQEEKLCQDTITGENWRIANKPNLRLGGPKDDEIRGRERGPEGKLKRENELR